MSQKITDQAMKVYSAAQIAAPGAAQPWYRRAFQADYLDVYLHRDDAEAQRAVRFLQTALDLAPGQRLLDLCCGPGRHLAFLGGTVGRAVGLDLSRPLLRRAQERWVQFHQAPAPLVQGTMARLPLATAGFDRVVNLFTSFGYFEAEADNAAVLAEIARVLRPGGLFAIDHINREAMLAGLRHRTQRSLSGGAMVLEHRHWHESTRRVVKDVEIVQSDGQRRDWRESVRVYEPDELAGLLQSAGLEPIARHGDYDGSPWSPAAPRLLLLARRA